MAFQAPEEKTLGTVSGKNRAVKIIYIHWFFLLPRLHQAAQDNGTENVPADLEPVADIVAQLVSVAEQHQIHDRCGKRSGYQHGTEFLFTKTFHKPKSPFLLPGSAPESH